MLAYNAISTFLGGRTFSWRNEALVKTAALNVVFVCWFQALAQDWRIRFQKARLLAVLSACIVPHIEVVNVEWFFEHALFGDWCKIYWEFKLVSLIILQVLCILYIDFTNWTFTDKNPINVFVFIHPCTKLVDLDFKTMCSRCELLSRRDYFWVQNVLFWGNKYQSQK